MHSLERLQRHIAKLHEVPTSKTRHFARHQLSYLAYTSSSRHRISQQFDGSYLPHLPRFLSLAPTRSLRFSDSLLRWLPSSRDGRALPLLRLFSCRLRYISWLRLPQLALGFPGKRFQKPSGTRYTTSTSTDTPQRHILSSAPSRGYTMPSLSYPASHPFGWSQVVQLSPQTPAAFLRPQQPRRGASSCALLLMPRAGFTPAFTATRHSSVTREPVCQ